MKVNDAERFAEEGARLAREDGVVEFIRAGGILLACIRVQRGEPEGGVSLLAEMVAQYRRAEILHLFPLHLSSLADAYWQVGRVEEGLATIAEALHTTETYAGVFWAAEVHRLKGELTLQKSKTRLGYVTGKSRTSSKSKRQRAKSHRQVRSASPQHPDPYSSTQEEAEACFLQALEVARQQESQILGVTSDDEPRCLWQQQGKQHAARNTLSAIYGWFTEGFDTADLREAKVLLDAWQG